MSTDLGYIYSLNCPITNEPKYIGQTMRKLTVRLTAHVASSKRERNKRTNWIASLTSIGIRPSIELIDTVPVSELSFWEMHYISLYKSWGIELKNSTGGGESIYTPSQEVKNKIGAANKGRVCSPETRKKISIAGKGQKRSEASRKNYSAGQIGNKKWLGKKHTAKTKLLMSEKNKGRPMTLETKLRLRLANIGRVGWNKKHFTNTELEKIKSLYPKFSGTEIAKMFGIGNTLAYKIISSK